MSATTESTTTSQRIAGHFLSKFPVLLPEHPALTYNAADFEAFLKQDVKPLQYNTVPTECDVKEEASDESATLVTDPSTTTTGEVRAALDEMALDTAKNSKKTEDGPSEHPFMRAIHDTDKGPERDMENMMQTENGDLANRSTKDPLVDLFYELEDVASGPRVLELLEKAWESNSLSTLKIIVNARSIHLGKSSRSTTYKCFGWLAHNHPLTLLLNLQWLTRPLIEKKLAEKKDEQELNDTVLVEAEKDDADPTKYDVKNGVAHGYWKDLLNVLALCIDGKLNVLANPKDLLNIENKSKNLIVWDATKAKDARVERKTNRHEAVVKAFEDNPFYRDLHLTVARLFADQLKVDLDLLRKDDKKAARQISLCAKWAPSLTLFHDKHTFICSSIAELLHPQKEFADYNVPSQITKTMSSREVYLRNAREAYRKDISSLRAALGVVEREISSGNFSDIKYERVPSLAMNQYASLFIKKDTTRFDEYITGVAKGQKNISGATLLPSKLVSMIRNPSGGQQHRTKARAKSGAAKNLVDAKLADMSAMVIDGQWRALVKRIKDSGKLENSIAVADVSGSMSYPQFSDGSTPMDSAIGLGLLLAEITAPPFGGSFITFSETPKVEKVRGETFKEKVVNLGQADWGMSTDFVAVFDKLILPMAKKYKVKQEDMVKQVFVFSDMQFNTASSGSPWSTSYERIKLSFERSGYQMPQLVFWNLAGGRAGMTGSGDPIAPKPVTAEQEGTVLVSGYSQGMLKVFLDNGAFEDPEAEEELAEEEIEEEDSDGEIIVQVKKKQKVDPMSMVRKAISHKAYDVLKVVD